MSKRERLIALVEKIMASDGTETEIDAWVEELESEVPHPAPSDLIFFPQDGKELTAAEVVDMALSYQAIRLGPSSEAQQ